MEVYQLEEKKQIIRWHHNNYTVRKIRELFSATFEDRPKPSLSTLTKIIQNFEQCGCLFPAQHKKSPVPQAQSPDDNKEMLETLVCATIIENPTLSSVQIAEAVNSSATTVRRILKRNGYRSYKVKKCKEILSTDKSYSS